MNIAKNMEAIVLVAIALAIGTSYAQATTAPVAQQKLRTASVSVEQIDTITVTAKRLTAAEKAAFN